MDSYCIFYWKKIENKYLKAVKMDKLLSDRIKTIGGELDVNVTKSFPFQIKDLPMKMSITDLFGNAIWNDTTEHAIEQIVKYEPSIIAASGRGFFNMGRTRHYGEFNRLLMSKI